MQLRFATGLTSEQYVNRQAWRQATLPRCPLHPQGGCAFARHGSYARVRPAGTRIARWYCPQGHRTFSLLPDCFAARLCGSLCALEEVVVAVEQASSLEQAADRLRPDIELPGAIRWTRRRVKPVQAALTTLKGLLPEHFTGCPPSVSALRERLSLDPVLPAVREIAAVYLAALSAPLGLRPPQRRGGEHPTPAQQQPGPDPPPSLR